MKLALLLLTGNLWAQSNTSTPQSAQTVNSTNLPGQAVNTVLQQNKLIGQVKDLLSGNPTITGIPNYKNGIDIGGVLQNGIGGTLVGNNIWTGTQNFKNTVTYSGSSGLGLGPGLMVLVASATYSTAVTTMSVAIPAGFATYNLVIVTTNTYNSATGLALRFDNNSTSGKYNAVISASGGSAMTSVVGNPCGAGLLTLGVANYVKGSMASYVLTITPSPSFFAPVKTQVIGGGAYSDTGSVNVTDTPLIIGIGYTGAAPTSVQIVDIGGGACTAFTSSAAGLKGILYVYAMPF